MQINGREIGPGHPPYVVAEVSCNHGGSLPRALQMIDAAKAAGADAVKFQAYMADTITIDADFVLTEGPWKGQRLYDLYSMTQTPFDWFPHLAERAQEVGITWFASVFDRSSLDMLEGLGCPAYKIASMEIVDTPLIRYAASKGKPMIISTGMASREEIAEAWQAVRDGQKITVGGPNAIPLHCISGYPTPAAEANLSTMKAWVSLQVTCGISDHTPGIEVPIAAVALGACIIEKHFIISHRHPSADSTFSLDSLEFKRMATAVRATWAAMQPSKPECEESSLQLRRSLYVVADMSAGDIFTAQNVRSIRPAYGLPPKEIDNVLGMQAICDIARATPLTWNLVLLNP